MERLWADAEAAYRDKILALLKRDPSAVLLDVGGDDGAWTEELRRALDIHAQQVDGMEIVEERAELARSRGFDVRAGDLDTAWPFANRSFHVVHANQVIEHVKRIDHFAAEIKRVLVPGGFALVCTENLASWHNVAALTLGYQPFSLTNISKLRPIGNPFALHAGEPPAGESWQHVHVLTLVALRDLFDAHGFALEALGGRATTRFPAASRAVSPVSTHATRISSRSWLACGKAPVLDDERHPVPPELHVGDPLPFVATGREVEHRPSLS
jgi:SAM-dependent methyltransferase